MISKTYTCTSFDKYTTEWYCCIGIIRCLFLGKLDIFISPKLQADTRIYSIFLEQPSKEAEELAEAMQNVITALDKFMLKKAQRLTYSPLEKMTKLIVGIELLKYEKEHGALTIS